MDLFMETDIGREADDLYALLYLLDSKTSIKGIFITPGDMDK